MQKPNGLMDALSGFDALCIADATEEEIEDFRSRNIVSSRFIPDLNIETLKIKEIERLGCTWRDVYRVKFDKPKGYTPGDAIGIISPNSDALVDDFMEASGLTNFKCKITGTGEYSMYYAGELRDFIKNEMDITGLPRKALLRTLSMTAENRKYIESLCRKEGRREYLRLAKDMVSLAEIIRKSGSTPVLDDLIRHCDPIKPRYYSLVNSRDKEMEVIIGVIARDVGGVRKLGHVSGWAERVYQSSCDRDDGKKYQNEPVRVCYRENKLMRGISTEKKLICFCTGTGISPFLSIYNNTDRTDNIILVYGFRNPEDDISALYELKCQVIRAMSSKGNYVTDHVDVVRDHRAECHVFICGNPKMQFSMFMKLKEAYPEIIEEKRVFFDNWQ